MYKFVWISTLLLFSASLSGQDKTALICGLLITGNDELPLEDRVILIEDQTIIEIGGRDILKDDFQVIDLSAYPVLPGLIDALGAYGGGSHSLEETVHLSSIETLMKQVDVLIYRLINQ